MSVIGSTKYYLHSNHLYSVAAATDSSGVWSKNYSHRGFYRVFTQRRVPNAPAFLPCANAA